MPPFAHDLEPVALPGEAVHLVPEGQTFEVEAVEQMAEIGPVDFGAATSGSDATENGSSIIPLEDELEMDDHTLGQFWVNPISDVEVEIRQTGQQEQRFVNANQVGTIRPRTPANQRVVYVYEDDTPHAIVTNPQTWDMSKTLVSFTGYKLVLNDQQMGSGGRNQMGGQPATVPTDSLKQNVTGGI